MNSGHSWYDSFGKPFGTASRAVLGYQVMNETLEAQKTYNPSGPKDIVFENSFMEKRLHFGWLGHVLSEKA